MSKSCDTICIPKVDVDQVMDIYTRLDVLVRKSLQEDYDCKKINGTTFEDTWAKMMSPAIGHILGAVVGLQNNETDSDRCIKNEQCDASKATTVRNDKATAEQIAASKAKTKNEDCLAAANCKLKDAQTKKVDFERSAVLPKQIDLTSRQIKGFTDNIWLKKIEFGMNGWAMAYSSGMLETTATPISDAELNLAWHNVP